MINIRDLNCLETATEVSNIYGGNDNRRTTNRYSSKPQVSIISQFINATQNINATSNGGTAIAFGINIIRITNVFL
ncbi:MAG: hypothetical protein KME64_23050 [Scytonematopsis contorta HA4267-MV1]|jgi:hypothetical protein|nr:hypothetical protein [Scytonematopsis contorta HA4267-MV1]